MGSKANRAKGHIVERDIITLLAKEFNILKWPAPDFQIASARQTSKQLDDDGIDIFLRNCPIARYQFQIKRKVYIGRTFRVDLAPLLRLQPDLGILVVRILSKAGKVNRTIGDMVAIQEALFSNLPIRASRVVEVVNSPADFYADVLKGTNVVMKFGSYHVMCLDHFITLLKRKHGI